MKKNKSLSLGKCTITFNGKTIEGVAYFETTICASARDIKRVHPIDEFDTLTAGGYKLNLITGEYHKPSSTGKD